LIRENLVDFGDAAFASRTRQYKKGRLMAVIEGAQGESSNRSFRVANGLAKPSNIWVELAWTVLEAADAFSDEIAIEACKRVIDGDSSGDLPAQSDMNAIFGFVDAHAH
jgi:hypothetical protein